MRNDIDPASYDGTSAFFFFLAYLRYKIDQDRVKQVHIAQGISVRPEYINRVYKGRQTCSVEVQENICRFLGISYLEALAIGKELIETGRIGGGRGGQVDHAPLAPVVKHRTGSSAGADPDIVTMVSQWVARKKEVENSLAEVQNLLENLPEALAVLDGNLLVTYQNRAHREMFGASLLGQASPAAQAGEEGTRGNPGSVAERTGMPARGYCPGGDGMLSTLTAPVRDMSGQITGYVEILRDGSEMEHDLLLAQESLDLLDQAVIVHDEHFRIRLANAKLRAITGAHDDDLTTFDRFLRHLREGGVCLNMDEFAELLDTARAKNREATIPLRFSSGRTYLYTTRPVLARGVLIGRMGVFTEAPGPLVE